MFPNRSVNRHKSKLTHLLHVCLTGLKRSVGFSFVRFGCGEFCPCSALMSAAKYNTRSLAVWKQSLMGREIWFDWLPD